MMNKLETQLGKTYEIPEGPGPCNYFDGIAFCEIDGRFCVFLAIQQYIELMYEEELRLRCLAEPEIPNNKLVSWLQLKKRQPKKLMATSFVQPEDEANNYQEW